MEATEKFHLKVKGIDQGLRLDQYIIKNLKMAISRSRIQLLIAKKRVTVNQACAKAHYKVKQNDSIIINIPPPAKHKLLAQKIPLEIKFEDDDILVINKPTGMVTHPAVGNYTHTLVNALLHYGCSLSAINGPLRPGIVHRLDKDTSGLIVVAKNDLAHLKLARQFRNHTVKRRYLAIVEGVMEHDEGIIDLAIGRDSRSRQKMAVNFTNGRSAKTRYEVLKRYSQATLLELAPYTGRTHQLRVHLNFYGHPILGDARYGRVSSFTRLALHATVLGFEHPRTGKFVQFQSELPKCLKRLIKSLNL